MKNSVVDIFRNMDVAFGKHYQAYKTINSRYGENPVGAKLQERNDKVKLANQILNEGISLLPSVNSLCSEIRRKQPLLKKLSESFINESFDIPDSIALGLYAFKSNYLKHKENGIDVDEIVVPHLHQFPIEKPMYIENIKEQAHLFQKIMLRLMFTLPMDRQEYYVYDPVGLGDIVMNFNLLFRNEKLFPQKKIMTSQNDLKDALKKVKEYINSLNETAFNPTEGVTDWLSYNRRILEDSSDSEKKKMLPYKVFIFSDIANEMDQECFDMIKVIINQSAKCGLLVMFSFNEDLLNSEDRVYSRRRLEVQRIVNESMALHKMVDEPNEIKDFKIIKAIPVGEDFPSPQKLGECLRALDKAVSERSKAMFAFDDLLSEKNRASGNSTEGLSIPVGFTTSGGQNVSMEIGDATPHFLVGGITGSGKSNFLHVLIMSACWKYSPDQMELYLLDFKEGVEFKQYGDEKLANVKLVATEANTEFGVKVLEHLDRLRKERYAEFKKLLCKDIKAYNSVAPQKMPRILVIIDEFQVLFDGTQKDRTMEMFIMLAKQGRACGIHMVLSTQSLKGLEFGNAANQFGGRIALKCSADDSKLLLGGISSNDEEASELTIPYGIMNVTQGSIAGNIKFAIPCAVASDPKKNPVLPKIKIINGNKDNSAIKIYNGPEFPNFPNEDEFVSHNKVSVLLGETIDIISERNRIELANKPDNNILICGRDEQMKVSMLNSVVLSALHCDNIDECVYVGDDAAYYDEFIQAGKLIHFESIVDFIASYKDNWFDKRRIVILDNCNLKREISFSIPLSDYPKDENKTAFTPFWFDCCKKGSFIVGFYDRAKSLKDYGIDINGFSYRVGYELNGDEMNEVLSNRAPSKADCKGKAFMSYNLEIKWWFKPFMKG